MNLEFFCTCPRGLEEVLAEELIELGIASAQASAGGVHFKGTWAECYRANLHSRIASRILWRIAKKFYRNEEDIYQLAFGQPWDEWFDANQTLRVDVTATKSPVRSVEFVTLRIKDAICDYLRDKTGVRPSIDTRRPDVRVFAFLDSTTCSLYLDTSGDALFKRGWRGEVGEAPLRENLAAGILRLIGWKPGMTLLDPMCGSGTFIVEAAQTVLGIAPGSARYFGFERLKNFDEAAWNKIQQDNEAARDVLVIPQHLNLHASDVSGDAIVATRANLERAGIDAAMAAEIAPKQIDAREIKPPINDGHDKGIMVVNPPYGERIVVRGSDSAEELFSAFGNTLKQRFAGWHCHVLTSDMAFQKKLRLAPSKRTPLFNGAIECRLFAFELVAGSRRDKPAVKA